MTNVKWHKIPDLCHWTWMLFFFWKFKNFLSLLNLQKRLNLKQKKFLVHHGPLHGFDFKRENNGSFRINNAIVENENTVFSFQTKCCFFCLEEKAKRLEKLSNVFFFFIETSISIINGQSTKKNKKKLKTSFFQIKFVTLVTSRFQYDRIELYWINVIAKIGRPRRFIFWNS